MRYLSGRVPGDRVMLLQGNAFRLLGGDLGVRPFDAGKTEPSPASSDRHTLGQNYDLIYSAGLYDYIPDSHHGQGGVPALTAILASLLKAAGRLLVGNYLPPSAGSRHQPHHRAMMELYSNWHLHYRDVDEIRAFTTAIDRRHALDLVDETGRRLRSAEESVIGFACIQAR